MNPSSTPLRRRLLACAAFAALHLGVAQAQVNPPLPNAPLSAGVHVIHAEVARTPMEQQIGLMNRQDLQDNNGMLFVLDEPRLECMWMRNTLVPLSVAFIGADGSIVNIEDMKARTDDTHCATAPVSYALEMPLGWFKKIGIKAGSKIRGLPTR
ncbi:DUF192 domain-containing protein [soil metagenome]